MISTSKPNLKTISDPSIQFRLTADEAAVLRYLDGVMEASAKTLGKIMNREFVQASERCLTARAAAVCGKLRHVGAITKVTELNAWRITKEGRAALMQFRTASHSR